MKHALKHHGQEMTPFRYPGGKAFLCPEIERRIDGCAPVRPKFYAEPYAGGAGAAIKLLATNAVERIYLNDFDWRIYSAWQSIIAQPARFIDRIGSIGLDVETWQTQREIVYEADSNRDDPFDVGFAAFFLNRTNRSGIIVGAGPIGGYGQTGTWKIDARFPRTALAARVKWISEQADRIVLSNKDGLQFLRETSAAVGMDTYFFIDPPYVNAGSRLYMNAMSEMLHLNLAKFLITTKQMPNWLVTYDDAPLVREAYRDAIIEDLGVKYSLQRKRAASELLIAPA